VSILSAAEALTELKKKTAKEYAGPCPGCGGEDRFLVWPDKGRFHCRGCGKTGDLVTLLREFADMSCPDAHESAGQSCTATNCPAWEKCRLGARANGEAPKRKQRESLQAPVPQQERSFTPDHADTPQDKWQQQAAALIEKAHAALLADADQLAYLAKRGLPLEAVKQYRLGWLPENRYPKREAWGLPTECKQDGTPKKMLLPEGILIPFFAADNSPHRLRIRRSHPRSNDPRYYWVPGSGNDVPVIGPETARGVVVIESDLDSLMVCWQCRDLDICTLPLGTVSAKPKDRAFAVCNSALAILVALDCDERTNKKTGLPDNPGALASRWWEKQWSRAQRWPVPTVPSPSAKDPGEYFEAGGDIRAWVLAGLPPVFKLKKAAPKKPEQPAPKPAPPQDLIGTTVNGHKYVIAADPNRVHQLREQHQDAVVFTGAEIARLRGMSKEEAEQMLLAKKEFGGFIESTRTLEPGETEEFEQRMKETAIAPQQPAAPEMIQSQLGI
jgi:hypothetical protein